MTFPAIMLVLHILSVVVWVGGMIFAHQMLRPVVVAVLEPPERLKVWADRKSTRLNSSHDQISYAVFCLITKH